MCVYYKGFLRALFRFNVTSNRNNACGTGVPKKTKQLIFFYFFRKLLSQFDTEIQQSAKIKRKAETTKKNENITK